MCIEPKIEEKFVKIYISYFEYFKDNIMYYS